MFQKLIGRAWLHESQHGPTAPAHLRTHADAEGRRPTHADGVRRTYGSRASGRRVVAAGAALANRVSEDVQQRPGLPPGQAPRKRLHADTAACGTRGKVTHATSLPVLMNVGGL